MIKFEWDTAKATANQKKHHVTFEEAKSVFYDEFAVQFYDDSHSETKHRFLMLSFSCESRMLLVFHCERDSGNTISTVG